MARRLRPDGSGPPGIGAIWPWVRAAIVLLGVWGAAGAMPPGELPGLAPSLVRALKLTALGALAAAALIERGAAPGGAADLRAGIARWWPSFVPLALLPLVPEAADAARWAAWGAAALVTVVRDRVPDGAAWAPPPAGLAWSRALRITALVICVAYVAAGTTAAGSTDNDPAYYFGVARHILRVHGYQEPIVWHFLVKPASVLHRPFDYWSGLASLSLLPFFALFGDTHRVAGAAMGLVTGLSIVGFAHLLGTAAPLRSRIVQLVSLLLYAFSPALMRFRFDVETIPFVHLWMILSLVALARRRSEWAVLCAFLVFWSRPEDVVLAVVLSAVAVATTAESPESRLRLRRTLLTGAICGGAYLLCHLLMFGTPLPPGAMLGRQLADYGALYRWDDARPATWTLADHFTPEYLAGRVHTALSNLQDISFFPNYPIWLGLAVLRGCCWSKESSSVEGTSWLLLFGGAITISLVNPTMFAGQRTLHALLPVFVLAGGYGAEAALAALGRITAARLPWARAARLAVTLGALLLAFAMLRPLPFTLTLGAPPLPFEADLAALDATLDGGTTMSTRPWSVIAETRSPAVFLPENGEAAMEAVIRKYHVRWLLLLNEGGGPSQAIQTELNNGTRHNVGGLTLTRRLERNGIKVFEVSPF
ncbi:MAG TPA: hypothetical protein VKZ18_18325 [Polyangia bacterium]|nr:hypothetical protein [Polyangia bacterium]